MQYKHPVINDIRIWLLFFLLLRMFAINNPPLETQHNWRQTTVCMVARNFVETDARICFPRIDIAGNLTGITGMEFPLLNYLIYLVSLVFGYEHYWGRIINLLVSTVGLWYFYRIVKLYFQHKHAFYATLLMVFSLWFSFSRKIMPDTFSVSLILISLYYGIAFFRRQKPIKDLLLYTIFAVLGMLSKIPAAIMLAPLLFVILKSNTSLQKKIVFSLLSFVAVVPTVFWYYYRVPYLTTHYGFSHFFMGVDISEGLQHLWNDKFGVMFRFYDSAMKYIGFLLFVAGTFMAFRNSEKNLIYPFVVISVLFVVFMIVSGPNFAEHNYYIIPYIPLMALIAAYPLTRIKHKKLAIIILIAAGVEGIAGQQHDFFINKERMALMQLETDLNKICPRNTLIVINSNDYPTPMYFAHRKGWIASNNDLQNEQYIKKINRKGCRYIVVLKKVFGTAIDIKYPIIHNCKNYTIYSINKTSKTTQ